MFRFKTTFLIICLIGLAGPAVAAEQQLMSVQVKEGQVRSAPSFLGKIVFSVAYGNRVAVFGEKGAWSLIGMPGRDVKGWIHASALTRKKIVLKAGAADVSQAASSDEIALAGKGFNAQVENEFRAKNPNIDFTWIDRMEAVRISPEEMQRFLKEGGLAPEGGL
ncbi:MAG: SH3 domain-containing protein [Proteobacteria bacterium]|nr:SH3 domain-containing protein [Pseudomonadota bacterium]